jgi:hypothetical protein
MEPNLFRKREEMIYGHAMDVFDYKHCWNEHITRRTEELKVLLGSSVGSNAEISKVILLQSTSSLPGA